MFDWSSHPVTADRSLQSSVLLSELSTVLGRVTMSAFPNAKVAETERFELSVQMYPYDGLANRWFQPLTHVSGSQQRAGAIARGGGGGKG